MNAVNAEPEDFNIPDNPLYDDYTEPISREEYEMIERMWDD
jgi:hypothetical protein